MTGHTLINTGAGWRCLRCKVAWDQGDEAPETCEAGDDYAFVTDLSPDATRIPDDPFCTTDFDQVDPRIRSLDIGIRTTLTDAPCRVGAKPFPKPDAMTRMIGGSHYSTLAIQPTEFCQRNGLDFCIGSILKYLTRYRAKNGREDLLKSRHFVEIRQSFPWHIFPPNRIEITMLEYVTRNGIRPDDAEALYRLEAYYNNHLDGGTVGGARRLIAEIDKLIDLYA